MDREARFYIFIGVMFLIGGITIYFIFKRAVKEKQITIKQIEGQIYTYQIVLC